MRPIPPEAEALIKDAEALILRVYDDKHPRRILTPGYEPDGVLTAGWGHTGPDVHIGLAVTRALAQKWFVADVEKKAARLLVAKIGDVVEELTDGQYGALLSFVFNLGTGNPAKPEWRIWKLLRNRDFDQVPAEMMRFVNWDGKKSEGLVNRRAAEVALWSKAEPGSVPHAPPSSVTRREATPPTPTDPVPPSRSATVITAALGVVATVPVAAQQVTAAVEPYKDASPWIGQAIAIVATIAAAAAVLSLVLSWLKKREERH